MVAVADGRPVLEVADDGRGGARQAEGSGLVVLDDRVERCAEAADHFAAAVGTTARAEFPLPLNG